MCIALSYPHTKAMTLRMRRAGACGQLQVGVEVQVKSDSEGWVLGEPSPQCQYFLEGQGSWVLDSFSCPFCPFCQMFRPVTPKPPPYCPPLRVPSARATFCLCLRGAAMEGRLGSINETLWGALGSLGQH